MAKQKQSSKKSNSIDYSSYVPCVRYQNGKGTWRANPNDPYLYISYDSDQIFTAYGNDSGPMSTLRNAGMVDLSDELIPIYNNTLQNEWINRANLPIRFLPENASAEEIRNKNVAFIVGRSHVINPKALTEPVLVSNAATYSYSSPYIPGDRITPSDYKVMMFPNIPASDITNANIQTFLHESTHTLIEGKHFKPHDNTDTPPYCDLTCLDTALTHRDECPPVTTKFFEIFGYQRINVFNPDPVFQEQYCPVKNAYPTILGPVDLAAAEDFKRSWEQRNQNARNAMPEQKASDTQHGHDHIDLQTESSVIEKVYEDFLSASSSPFQFAFDAFDSFVQSCVEYCHDLANSCTSYFNPNSVNSYYRNTTHGLMFNSTTNLTANNLSLIASNSSLPALTPG